MAAVYRIRCQMVCVHAAGGQLERPNRALGQLRASNASIRQDVCTARLFRQMCQSNLAGTDMPSLHCFLRQMPGLYTAGSQMRGFHSTWSQLLCANTAVRQNLAAADFFGQMG
ncbi:hypothetical protein D3C73_1297970 [compost metagenome]